MLRVSFKELGGKSVVLWKCVILAKGCGGMLPPTK